MKKKMTPIDVGTPMGIEHEPIEALVELIKQERESRMLDIAHSSLHLRATKLMVEGLMFKIRDGSLTQDLEALYTCLDDSMTWMNSLLNKEAERKPIDQETKSKVIH